MADDKSLDLTSDEFDPIKALYSPKVTLPSPRAPVLDNITKFYESSEGVSIKERNTKPKVSSESTQPSTSTGRVSRFQPHQEPVPAREKKAARTVLTRMNTAEGPLSMLQKCMNEHVRIKVLTRDMAGIRGHCIGYLLAFDKHFNMALECVTEVWTRKKRTKIPPLGADEDIPVPLPKVRVISSTAKTETCERYIPKIMMRGEHVVLVTAVDT